MNNRWELYEIKDYKKINTMLDKHFNGLINEAKIKIGEGEEPILVARKVRKNMESLMDSLEGYGVSDTEPRSVLVTSIFDELELPLNEETINLL